MTDVITKVAIGGVEYPFAGGSAEVAAEDVSYDNTTSGMTADNVQDALDEVFQSVSNGKELIAAAITDKGVSTAASDSFTTMASNISNIETLDIATETTKINAVTGGNAIGLNYTDRSSVTAFSVVYSDKNFTVIYQVGDSNYSFLVVPTGGIGDVGNVHFSGSSSDEYGSGIMNIVGDGTYYYVLFKHVKSSYTEYTMYKLNNRRNTGSGVVNKFSTDGTSTNLGRDEDVAIETFNTETIGCVADQGIVTGLSQFTSGTYGNNYTLAVMQIDYTKIL